MSLLEASKRGDLDHVRQLLSAEPGGKGANPNVTDEEGRTPLYMASLFGRLEVVKELLSAPGGGANPNIATKDGRIPLYWASYYDHLEIVKVLLAAGADPSVANKNGNTPLLCAIINKHFEVIELLETYFPSLVQLSLRSIRKFKIGVSSIPENLLE